MGANWGVALFVLALASTAHAQADLRVTSSVSPSSNLVVGQEIVVTITATNDGPSAAQQVLLFWSTPSQPFVFELAEPVAPVCEEFQVYDIDPPRNNFSYLLPTLAAGEQRTCMARMRVRITPPGYQLPVAADAFSGQTPDTNTTNNVFAYQLTFATPAPLTIPTMTAWGLIVMVAGALSVGFFSTRWR